MFRKYNAAHGRWMSPDPAGLAAVDPSTPQTWNRYGYVGNSPLNTTDNLGLYYGICDVVYYYCIPPACGVDDPTCNGCAPGDPYCPEGPSGGGGGGGGGVPVGNPPAPP